MKKDKKNKLPELPPGLIYERSRGVSPAVCYLSMVLVIAIVILMIVYEGNLTIKDVLFL